MKKKIIYGLLLAVAMVTATSSFVSCKDYEGDDVNGLKEQIALQDATLRAFIQAQINAIKQCECDPTIASRLATIESDYLKAAALNGYATEAWVNGKGFTTLGDVQSWVNQQGFSTLTMDAVQQWVNEQGYSKDSGMSQEEVTSLINTILLQTLGENNKVISDMITNALANGENPYWTKNEIINYFNTLNPDLSGYATKDDLNNLRNYILLGDSVKNAYAWASYSYQRIIAQGDSLKGAYDSIANVRAEALENFNQAKALADSALKVANQALDSIGKVSAKVDDLDTKVNDLETAMKAADEALQNQINDLNERVTKNEQAINNILGTLKKQITGVIIQGTYSPVFGYGSLPLGIQTNILAAYAGKSTVQNEYEFPAYGKANTAANKAIITGEDYDFVESLGQWPATVTIPANEILVDETEGNAGVMYLTVNPTNVDFSGTDFSLVNSAGEKSRIQLSNLDACSDVMTFGWTRGASVASESKTGFYSAKATITKDNVENMQPRFDKAGFKDAVKEAVNGKKRMAVKDLARSLYNSLEPVDRFGVRALWSDPTVGTRTVTSAFDIAAFSVEPLGFGFRVPESVKIPTINRKMIADSLHINLNIDPIVITAEDKASGKYIILIEIPEMVLDTKLLVTNSDGSQAWNGYDVAYIGGTIGLNYSNTNYVFRKGYAYLDFTPMFEELFGQFNAAFANFNDASASINKKIDKIATTVNSYIDKANGYINRANSVLANLSNAIQPVLIWSDGTNAGELGGFVSGTYAAGTTVKAGSDLALIATSYSLELLAPAYKKSLIVTNAYKNGNTAHTNNELKQAVKALNADIQAQGFDVFSGQSLKKPYIFKSDKVGVTYEIAYTAVDYEGKIAGRKFYVTVVE